jgi:predicted alpha/beta-fold hydrolase
MMGLPQHLLSYHAPMWLPGGNLQTIWSARLARRVRGEALNFKRERWDTPDGDFIDVDILQPPPPAGSPWLVQFHGLEGSSSSHYAQAFGDLARRSGMGYAVPHFRGCSGEINRAPRAYHAGDHEEIGWVLARMRQGIDASGGGALLVVGISLGGNALLRWAEEMGEQASRVATGVAAICSPVDLAAGGWAMGRGFNRWVYNRMFLASMKPRALAKLTQFPGLFDRDAMLQARDLYEFDGVFTAPLHGFASTEDYWARASAKPHLQQIRVPTLVVNARNDPFVPAWSLPHGNEVGAFVRLWQPAHGGHVGFCAGRWPGHVQAMPEQVLGWLRAVAGLTSPAPGAAGLDHHG